MKKKLSSTNGLIASFVILYALDRYIIKIPNTYAGFRWEEAVRWEVTGMPEWVRYLLGFCGGRLTDIMAIMGSGLNENGHALYRYVTYLFMHGFLIHLIVNVLALFIIGNFVEKKLGPSFMLGIFLLSGAIAGIVSEPIYRLINTQMTGDEIIVCGASGGIFGLMGAGLIICLVSENKLKTMKLWQRIILGLYGIVFTYLANGNILSCTMIIHNVGLIVGIIMMLLIWIINRRKKKSLLG